MTFFLTWHLIWDRGSVFFLKANKIIINSYKSLHLFMYKMYHETVYAYTKKGYEYATKNSHHPQKLSPIQKTESWVLTPLGKEYTWLDPPPYIIPIAKKLPWCVKISSEVSIFYLKIIAFLLSQTHQQVACHNICFTLLDFLPGNNPPNCLNNCPKVCGMTKLTPTHAITWRQMLAVTRHA